MRQWSGATDSVRFPAENVELYNVFTLATVMNRTSAAGSYRQAMCTRTSGGTGIFEWGFRNDDVMYIYHNAHGSIGLDLTFTSSNGLVLGAVTWDGSPSIVRCHRYVYSTGVWTHDDATGFTNSAAPGAGAEFQIGNNPNNDAHQGPLAAIALWSGRGMSDGEVERLVRGRWSETNPTFHVEFPSGIDDPANARDQSRTGRRQTSVSGTSRSAVADPPGFRFSPQNRRR